MSSFTLSSVTAVKVRERSKETPDINLPKEQLLRKHCNVSYIPRVIKSQNDKRATSFGAHFLLYACV